MSETIEDETVASTPGPTAQLEAELGEIDEIDRPSENPAVSRCIRAFNRANRKCRSKDPDTTTREADDQGAHAYLRAMPPLAGVKNTRDYIACVTFALLTEIISPAQAENFFSAAKVALAATRCGPKAP